MEWNGWKGFDHCGFLQQLSGSQVHTRTGRLPAIHKFAIYRRRMYSYLKESLIDEQENHKQFPFPAKEIRNQKTYRFSDELVPFVWIWVSELRSNWKWLQQMYSTASYIFLPLRVYVYLIVTLNNFKSLLHDNTCLSFLDCRHAPNEMFAFPLQETTQKKNTTQNHPELSDIWVHGWFAMQKLHRRENFN
uniref:Uncharacterized protein n=1 Tax=Sphaerodactylus townsendi TaxID=933632 RepID=A0ACB8G133_9SAUR